uniref:GON domain-containing protein n=1 Tax=Branchiostoma floridae TaxID=7739 RepID=C3ZZW3_BRAFL|eukprot:XP_002585905.1 hypothetical protein BRAFLDRAFT_110811 [Branchiostoma floridae]
MSSGRPRRPETHRPRKITMGNWTYSKAFVLLYFAVMWPNQNVYGITKQDAARLKRRISEVQAKIDRLTLRVAHTREHTLSQRLPAFTQPHATTGAVGLWPLNARFGASDITGNGNDGTSTGTQLAAGPYGDADGAFLFSGTANSYIDIPNNGKLDVRYSFTILAHVYPTGEDGPIFDYVGTNPNTWYWALHFWQYQPHDLQLRPIGREGPFSDHVVARVLQLNDWNYVGGTYDSTTGVASLWSNGELAREQYIGVAEVASQHPVRVAVRAQDEDDSRYFAGRIACLQLYNYAMTQEQIVAARDACKGLQSPGLQHTDDDDAGHKPTSCAEAKSARSNINDGEYTLYPFSTDSDVSLRVYCHDMASEKPKEFLTLPSGPDENYAIFFGDRLVPQNMFQCTGPLQKHADYQRFATSPGLIVGVQVQTYPVLLVSPSRAVRKHVVPTRHACPFSTT